MKVCINCKHRNGILDSHLCYHPNNGMDPVTGRVISVRCVTSRRSDRDDACGPDGRFFEEAPKRVSEAPPEHASEAPRKAEALTCWQRVKAFLRGVRAW